MTMTMTSSTDDQPSAPNRTIRFSAELCPAGHRVVIVSDGEQVADFDYKENYFREWQESFNYRLSTTELSRREAEYQRKADAMAEQLAETAGAARLSQKVAAAGDEPPGTVFLRVELPQRELDIIPWELLALAVEKQVGGRDVCVYRAVRWRKIRRIVTPDAPQRVVLGDSSPLSQQPVNFAQERESIRQELGPMRFAGLVDTGTPCLDADPGMLAAAMDRPARAVHFAAQGQPGRVQLRQGEKSVPYSAESFAQFFIREPVPAAIALSVCHSVPAPPLPPRQQPGAEDIPGIARALAEGGVPAVIAMYSIITPEAAKEFFTALYRALGQCDDMVAAYAAAVKALRTDIYQNRSLWSVPVLYSNDNVIPFPGTLGGSRGSYQQIVDQVAGLRAELSAVQPEEGWSDSTWRRETLRLLVNANGRRRQLR
jgi:hypothetical protein